MNDKLNNKCMIKDKIGRLYLNKTFRNGSLFTLFSFLNQGIGFFIMLIMGRYVLPESYGKLSLFTTIIQLLSIYMFGHKWYYYCKFF